MKGHGTTLSEQSSETRGAAGTADGRAAVARFSGSDPAFAGAAGQPDPSAHGLLAHRRNRAASLTGQGECINFDFNQMSGIDPKNPGLNPANREEGRVIRIERDLGATR